MPLPPLLGDAASSTSPLLPVLRAAASSASAWLAEAGGLVGEAAIDQRRGALGRPAGRATLRRRDRRWRGCAARASDRRGRGNRAPWRLRPASTLSPCRTRGHHAARSRRICRRRRRRRRRSRTALLGAAPGQKTKAPKGKQRAQRSTRRRWRLPESGSRGRGRSR